MRVSEILNSIEESLDSIDKTTESIEHDQSESINHLDNIIRYSKYILWSTLVLWVVVSTGFIFTILLWTFY